MRTLLMALIAVSASPAGAQTGPDHAAIRQAIVTAVQARMGTGAEVVIEGLRVPAGWPHATAQARPDPGAKIGRPIRFALGSVPSHPGASVAWTGAAQAEVRVLVEHLHTSRAVSRGQVLAPDDVTLARHAVSGALRAWPAADAIDRSRALRDLAPGTCLVPGSLASVPLVRAGQAVHATVRIGEVLAEASLVAADNGDMGSVIRVVNPDSRRTLRARVTGAGIVEVMND